MFNTSELSDIRIALQDRIRIIEGHAFAYQTRNAGLRDDVADIEIARLRDLLNKVSERTEERSRPSPAPAPRPVVEEGLCARIVEGSKPTALDAAIEANKRGYGKAKAEAFGQGVLRITSGCAFPRSDQPRVRAWEDAGEAWAREEIARRAATA